MTPRHRFRRLRPLAIAGLLLAAAAAQAQLPPPSGRPLNEARGSVIKGQSAGVQLIGPRASDAAPSRTAPAAPSASTVPTAATAAAARPAPAAPAAPVTAPTTRPVTTSTAAAAPPTPTATAAPATKPATAPAAPRWGEPPRGSSMAAGKRLESPSLGIPLPFAGRAASAPAGSR